MFTKDNILAKIMVYYPRKCIVNFMKYMTGSLSTQLRHNLLAEFWVTIQNVWDSFNTR